MIPVYEPWVGEEEAEAVKQAVVNGEYSGLFSKSLTTFEEQFSNKVGCRHGIAVTSGTTALHLAIAQKHALKVIEDCAESHGATWRGKDQRVVGRHGLF